MSSVNHDAYLTVVEDRNSGLYHGAMYYNHPTPSGCPRFLLGTTTQSGYESQREAAKAINLLYPHLEPIDLAAFEDTDISSVAIPLGAEVTLVTPRDRAETPYVSVTLGRLPLAIPVSVAQFERLRAKGIVELDSSSGNDPELSARYDHYQVLPQPPASIA